MIRRTFLPKAVGTLLATLGFSFASRAADAQGPKIEGGFVHVVYFWMRSPADRVSNQRFLESLNKFLAGVDVIIESFVGTPAGTPRDVVDNSYTYSLIVTFANKKNHEVYQSHPAHIQFIEESQELWTKVQVFDSVPVK